LKVEDSTRRLSRPDVPVFAYRPADTDDGVPDVSIVTAFDGTVEALQQIGRAHV